MLTVMVLAASAAAQRGDLPVPADLETSLQQRGYKERFLPVQAATLEPSSEDTRRGWMLYRRDRNYEVLPNSRPAPHERLDTLRITATPGEIESEPFSIFALRETTLQAEPSITASPAGTWLAQAVTVEDVLFHPVQYTISKTKQQDEVRGESGKTYLRYPVFVRATTRHVVPAQSSRLYWVTAAIPDSAPAGVHRATIRIADAAGNRIDLPLEVEVLPFRLTTRNLPRFGAFLSAAPIARAEWAFMKRYGMDAAQWFWNAHPIRIRNENGAPRLDFTEYDAAVKGMKDAGMRGPLVLSLGNAWLGHYEIELSKVLGLPLITREMEGRKVTLMDMTDPRWERPYIEGLKQIFAHAREAQWPELALLIMDEPTKHAMAYHPYRYHLIKKHFPDIPVYGVFFQPEKDPGPLLHSSDIVVANRDLERTQRLARQFGKRFWSYNNVTADESFGKIRVLYGQIPAYYGSEVMWFWCWNYWIGNAWDDFDRDQSDADWVAVYPSVDGREPVRTLAIEAAREAIDDVRYLKTLEETLSGRDPARWTAISAEIRRRQKVIFDGIRLDERINSDADFFITTRNDAPESLRKLIITELRNTGFSRSPGER
jgi:hypothetical protein